MDYVLKASHLVKNYPGFSLKDVSLNLPSGCIMGFIGENGAGKSTTFKALLDLIRLDGGFITFWGQTLAENSAQLKEDIGIVFDNMNFYETLTPKQIGRICSSTYKNRDAKIYQNYLTRFSLPEQKELKTFSKGMQVKQSLLRCHG